MTTNYKQFDFKQTEDTVVVHLHALDETNFRAPRDLFAELSHLYYTENPRHLIIDFSKARWYPAEALSSLLVIRQRFSGSRKFICTGLSNDVQSAFRFLSLDNGTFEFCPNLALALSTCKAQTPQDATQPSDIVTLETAAYEDRLVPTS